MVVDNIIRNEITIANKNNIIEGIKNSICRFYLFFLVFLDSIFLFILGADAIVAALN